MTKETSGPAFPVEHLREEGMDLRDYFAGLALQSLLPRGHEAETTARYAYAMADAMLQEKNKP